MSGSSRANGGSRKPAKAGGTSRSAAQPFDVAEDEYQAPFSLPVRQAADIPSDRPYDLREDAVPSSPYFDERESAEAIAWARSDEAIDTADDEDGLEPIAIGSKATRARRDSQVGSYDEQGSIFDGPTAGAVPSSISSMRHAMTRPELSHRTSSRSRRRISSESASHSPARSRTRADSQGHDDAHDASETASVRSSGRFSFARRETRRADADARDGDEAGTSYQPKGMLGNLLATFRGTEPEDEGPRRPGLGRRSSSGSVMSRGSRRSRARGRDGEEDDLADDQYDEEEAGRWSDEDYGASDDDDDDDDSADDRSLQSSEDGQSQSRGGLLPSAFGPLSGAVDPVFGDTRITTEHVPEDELDAQLGGHGSDDDLGTGFAGGAPGELGSASGIIGTGSNSAETDLTYLDKSARSRQQIYLPEEDALIRLTGYRTVPSRRLLYLIASWLTLGVVYLLARWLPRSRLRWICQETEFEEAEFIVIENQWGDLFMAAPKSIPFARPLATVFPATSREPPSTQAEFQAMAAITSHSTNASKVASAKSSIRSGLTGKLNGNGAAVPPSQAGIATEQLMDLVYIDYRYTRFILHPPSGRLRMLKDWRDPLWSSVGAVFNGVTWDAEKDRSALFGFNVIDIAAKTSIALLVDEVLHPFYMFQLVSIALWSVDNYYYYAACIAIISAASITTTLVETKRTVERMRLMSRFTCDVVVLREGRWEKRDSSELVPGDVYDVAEPGLLLFPADSVLLTGDAIVNESMLTGESVPVSKVPVTEEALAALQTPGQEVPAELARHFLFAGTRIIRIRGGGLAPNVKAPPATPNGADGIQHEAGARAMVVRTGFDTTKGALVRSMLFPKPMGFKFYRDSFRFIGFLAGIAGLGFLASAINFVEIGIAWHTIVLRALDLVTVVVPPALPATMSIGTTFAIARLRKAGVFCISPNRVNIGGKVNVFCFDKTGTLTADGLDVLGSRTVDLRAKRFSELHESADEMPVGSSSKGADADARNLPLLYALATCHSLKVVDGEVIGDPLDVKMFEYTGWTLDEGREQAAKATTKSGTAKDGKSKLTDRPPALVQTVVRPPGGQTFEVQDAVKSGRHAHFLELGVLRTFEFASALRRMSVIVKRLKSSSMEVFVKGAPEVMVDICDPNTFPADYEDLLAYYTKHGYRVIACAGKSLPGLTWIKAQRMKREQAESGLRFLGLIIFENKLKEGTAPAIESLRAAHIVTKMVTGDNPRTAISVARECGMVGPSAHVFMPTFVEGTQKSPRAIIDWSSVDDERVKLDPFRLRPLEVDPHVFDFEELDFQDYQLALTGDVFRWMVDYAPLDTLRRMLIKGGIFARMSPDEKHELIERLQALGYTVGMCGDGANDCGALKAADLGISLSEAEASVAAPFTSSSPDISCVLEVIREGRAALVTSFSCFKYMALYSLIQFTSITILYSFASSLGDFQFLYIDLFIILPVAVAMARTLPVDDIHPKRPTANLVSKKVLISLIGQVIISSAVQIFVFFYTRAQPWYKPPDIDPDQLNVINPENSALFLVSSFQYILVAAVFSVGPPYRKPMYTNPMLMLSLGILSALSLYFLFVPSGFFFDILGLVSFPTSFHWVLFGSVLVNVACAFAFEAYATLPATKALKALQRTWRRYARKDKDGGKSRKHDRKLYKVIADSEREQA